MNRHYDDLLGLTDEKPSFFQEGGVPRWAAFDPQKSTGVYAIEAAIVEIACQSCDMRFHVLMERKRHDQQTALSTRIREANLAYGDPPNVDCCPSGPSMNSEPVKVIEYWSRSDWSWSRNEEMEVSFRRSDDPWTMEMREKANALIADPGTTAETRAIMESGLTNDSQRFETMMAQSDPDYASELRTTSD